ncbi:acyl-CoA reductase [Massilia sp. CCM 9210]|uniref:acyl-CoA reductase n=1 Tax=Massilia scottii TaxID=3057166 RepID=UPI0027969935|nr:acyl-CoA reductase [Massilia sp. CCM 9210]MDQ1813459.1 acyl-CoA reductase [Massilia sp. CCM 9210]
MENMNKQHLWQGEWIGDQELASRIGDMQSWVARQMACELDIETVLAAGDLLGKNIREKSAIFTELKNCLSGTDQFTSDEIGLALLEIADVLRRANLEKKLIRELGSSNPLLACRTQFDDAIFEAWAPLGFLVHISPQNAFTVGPMSVLEGLLSGNFNFLKTSPQESSFPQILLHALGKCDPSAQLEKFIIVAKMSSKRKDLLEPVFAGADGIAAWGGEESIQSIRAMAPASVRIVEWGHKISLAFLSMEAAQDPHTLKQLAMECCLMEQQACSSPQCVYLDTSDWNELQRFGERLADALTLVAHELPRQLPDTASAGEIALVSECHRLESCLGNARLIEAPDGGWRIYIDDHAALAASPLYRSIWVKPLPRTDIIRVLRPMRNYLQTVAICCKLSEIDPLSRSFLRAGAIRIRRIGEMTGGYPGEPHDGVYALQRYCRRVSLQLAHEAQGISNFDELRKFPPLQWDPVPAITAKEQFQSVPADPAQAHLFFKSGGSTGEPKLSTFSYQQYHEHIRLGAEGLYAAGFDPLGDRAMNLFFGGGLYGGFISFFSALEQLGAIQFPMAAHGDTRMVAQEIVKNKVNVLLGMPSYILQLFEKEADILSAYRGVKKIYYGGEHFSPAQRNYLHESFQVDVIRSAAYGSVDIGPIGFQCEHSDGAVHHLQQQLQYLEILKMDEDRAVQGEEVGRLVFTPRMLSVNKPLRYEIGDVGHWIADPDGICACGRAAPRFRLLGRTGDICRIGSTFLNYQEFIRILATHFAYAGEAQLILAQAEIKDKVILVISDSERLPALRCREIFLENYLDLQEAVLTDETLLFEVQAVGIDEFHRTAGSGKLIRVLDRRAR